MIITRAFLLSLLSVSVPLLITAATASGQIYHGGPIITMTGDAPEMVESILVTDGKIAATGALAELKKRSKTAKHIDLRGRTLLPGFIDAHGHISYAGQAEGMAKLAPPPVGAVDTIAKLQEVLRAQLLLGKLPEGAPLIGNGYDDSQLAERRHPTRQDLDLVATNRPVVVVHASGHFAAANSFALAKFGITADTPDPKGGAFRREADGKMPNGVMEESALFAALGAIAPKGLDPAVESLVTGQKLYAANGITTAQDGRVMPEQWPILEEAAKRGALTIDTVALVSFERDWPEAVRARIGKPYQGRLKIGGIKLTVDGSPQGRTAWLHDPVPVPPPGKGADYRGYPAIDLKLFNVKLADAAKYGWQVFAHVNGDEAAQTLIDGVRANGLSGKRTIAIHNQVVRREQLEAMKALDIQPSFFANHTWYWGDWHRDVALGARRADFISPQATAWSIGLKPSAHNDSPVVPPDMMRLIWSSVNRRTQSGDILGPLERIPVYRALQQITINAAWQIVEDGEKGSIAAGKRADLVVLDTNPLSTESEKLFAIKVIATIKDGKTVFGNLE